MPIYCCEPCRFGYIPAPTARESLLAMRNKHELNIARANEAERKDQRFRNVMAELMNLQKLEKVQLNHFINQQVLAGKRDVYPGSKGRKGLKSLSSRMVIT